jgi:peptidyl-prolyl cis-trans isomerase B (cyclophilin B)
MKKLIVVMVVLMVVFSLFAAEEKNVINVEMTTNYGVIQLELYPDDAPITVANFVKYVKAGFFDGLIFHRIISNFMIQGGGFDQERNHIDATYDQIQNEADNGLSNEIGTIAMARTGAPHSASSQFFINVNDNTFLNHTNKQQGWGYCVFGKVTSGMDIVNQIKGVPTHFQPQIQMKDWPVKPVIIEKIVIVD